MEKKTYIRPETTAMEMESIQTLASSLTYDDNKDGLQQDENGYYVGE